MSTRSRTLVQYTVQYNVHEAWNALVIYSMCSERSEEEAVEGMCKWVVECVRATNGEQKLDRDQTMCGEH